VAALFELRSPRPGPQREKFLFYRGVSAFPAPVNATIAADSTIHLENQMSDEIPAAILFERHGAQLGYRMLGALRDQAAYAQPELSSSLDSLSTDLEGILISQGLFPDEAHAMLETWKNSWFEDGSRLIYVVPRCFIDSVLPLRVTPAPAATTRVFVGRLELITPATERSVESAFASNDQFTLAKYNRFLEPILRTMIQESTDSARAERLTHYLQNASRKLYASAKN
jgi:hypothetical protein